MANINMAKRKKKQKPESPEMQLERKRLMLTEQQTLLSKQRTILAFMQTGLAFVGVGIVIVNFLKESASQVIGWMLFFIGFIEILESLRRIMIYKKRMEKIKSKTKI